MKQWFEEWSITNSTKPSVLSILLPNAKNKHIHFELFEGQELTKNDLKELSDILLSAFDQIQRDNGGYEK